VSSIKVTHADSGLVLTTVTASRYVSPHIVRVTLGGGDLDRFAFTGFDQWFRLAIPVHASDRFDNLPARFGVGGLVKYLTLSKGTRPVIRNYTVRQYRSDPAEIDIDIVMHGEIRASPALGRHRSSPVPRSRSSIRATAGHPWTPTRS
jgi:NADPH-dependent ferric siderophore reductase